MRISKNWNQTKPIYGFVGLSLDHLLIVLNCISDSTPIYSLLSTIPISLTNSV